MSVMRHVRKSVLILERSKKLKVFLALYQKVIMVNGTWNC